MTPNMKAKSNLLFMVVLLVFNSTLAQVGVGTTNPDSAAALDISATNKGLLPPRMTGTERDNISKPPAGLIVVCSNCGNYGEMQVYNGERWTNITGGDPVSHLITSANGKEWMDRNLGANRVATSVRDADAYGDLYQWGRAADGHEDRTSGTYDGDNNGFPTTATASGAWDGKFITASSSPEDWLGSNQNDNLWQGVNGTNNPCPQGFRVPSAAEWDAERKSWSSNNRNGAYKSPLKLPWAGRRKKDGGIHHVDSRGFLWTSTVDGTKARQIFFDLNNSSVGSKGRAFGKSVRCIKN